MTPQRVAFAIVATVAPILLFGYMFGFDLPLASAPFWRMPKNDMMVMTAAYEAFVRQPWTMPLTLVSGLLAKPFSIVFTDSIPLLSVILKASGLGPYLNPLGLFLLLSYPLQAWGMIALLRALGGRRLVPLLIGAAMALLFPAWIMRQFGHMALAGHWVILFALALSIASARFGLTPARIAGFAALLGIATGVHAYHLPPVAACLGAALLAEVLQRRPGGWARVGVASAAAISTVALAAFLFGYAEGGGVMGGADALGFYSMNLFGPVMPQASFVFGQRWSGAWFTGIVDTSGGQFFEGFQYLGAGALLLIVVTVGVVIRDLSIGRRAAPGFWARWSPMIAVCLILTLWSIGWNVYAGPTLLGHLPKPSGPIAEVLGVFRCHGRFFWAVGYLLTAIAIHWISCLPPRIGLPLLGVALALQAVDTIPTRQGVRFTFAAPDAYVFPPQLASEPALHGRNWIFRPTFFCSTSVLDRVFINQLNVFVARSGGSTNTFATARNNDAPCETTPAAVGRDAGAGDRSIVVTLADGVLEGPAFAPVAQRADCYRFRRGVLCGRGLEGVEGLSPLMPGELAAAHAALWSERMDRPQRPPALGAGWAKLDPGGLGVWSQAREANLLIPAPAAIKPGGLVVELILVGYLPQGVYAQRVQPSVSGRRLAAFTVEGGGFNAYRFRVPADRVTPGQPLAIKLQLPDAIKPDGDVRTLGVGLQEIRILD
jgi:hypothetical protein